MTDVAPVTIGDVTIGPGCPLAFIIGPCVIEEEDLMIRTALRLKEIALQAGVPLIFKSSYEKDNRGLPTAYVGPGLEDGLRLLARVKEEVGLPVLSDIHRATDVKAAAEVLDVLQVPAYLCQQTSLLLAVGRAGLAVNVKKGQFLAPENMDSAVAKLEYAGCRRILLTERGSCFGYNRLVNDMMAIPAMKRLGYPVVFDAGHSVRVYGLRSDDPQGGLPAYIPTLAKAAVGAGCHAIFLEAHPDPAKAKCDAISQYPLDELPALLSELRQLSELVRSWGDA